MANEKTFLEKHAAAMVCHRQEHGDSSTFEDTRADAFDALADYADELAEMVAELEEGEEEPEFSTIAQCQAWRRGERPRTYTADEIDALHEDAWDARRDQARED